MWAHCWYLFFLKEPTQSTPNVEFFVDLVCGPVDPGYTPDILASDSTVDSSKKVECPLSRPADWLARYLYNHRIVWDSYSWSQVLHRLCMLLHLLFPFIRCDPGRIYRLSQDPLQHYLTGSNCRHSDTRVILLLTNRGDCMPLRNTLQILHNNNLMHHISVDYTHGAKSCLCPIFIFCNLCKLYPFLYVQ